MKYEKKEMNFKVLLDLWKSNKKNKTLLIFHSDQKKKKKQIEKQVFGLFDWNRNIRILLIKSNQTKLQHIIYSLPI